MMDSLFDTPHYWVAAFFILGMMVGGACGTTYPEATHGGVIHTHCWKRVPLEKP